MVPPVYTRNLPISSGSVNSGPSGAPSGLFSPPSSRNFASIDEPGAVPDGSTANSVRGRGAGGVPGAGGGGVLGTGGGGVPGAGPGTAGVWAPSATVNQSDLSLSFARTSAPVASTVRSDPTTLTPVTQIGRAPCRERV